METSQLSSSVSRKPRIRAAYTPGTFFVESRTRDGLSHLCHVPTTHCTCEAGKHGRRCWHLAVAAGYYTFLLRAGVAQPAHPAAGGVA